MGSEMCIRDRDITSAHIEVVGAMAVDTFYVRGVRMDDKLKKTLRANILDILRDPEVKSKAA